MVNNFGKFCRRLRIDRGEILADMAKKLGVSSAFLSKVETGGKKPPKEWKDKIVALYDLNNQKAAELDEYLFEAINASSLDMSSHNSNVLLKFIPSDMPTNDELKAIAFANQSIEHEGTVSIDAVNWD